ncbi:molluscan insulin-related peptide 1-like isoform X2 [Ruditapes philippinarum]|nr:molluscan insulin-related peptide 1-like isoform X2 [Ruditapes philippinarum]
MLIETLYMITMCLLSSTLPANSLGDKECTPRTFENGPHQFGICGNRIDELLGLLCANGHNELYPFIKRKRDASNELDKKYPDILMNREDANTYLQKRVSYVSTGIVCECCYNQCNIMELLSYCRPMDDSQLPRLLKRTHEKLDTYKNKP